MKRPPRWTDVCEHGWASVFNRDYVGAGLVGRLTMWGRTEEPWVVAYVEPGHRWEQRQHKRFKTFEQALAFIRGES